MSDERLALRALVEEYARAVDERDVPALVATFTADGWLETYPPGTLPGEHPPGHRFVGATELASVVKLLRRFDQTMHIVANHRTTVEGDEARGVATSVAHHISGGEGEAVDLVMYIRYVDRYLRTAAGWRFCSRAAVCAWMERRPVASS